MTNENLEKLSSAIDELENMGAGEDAMRKSVQAACEYLREILQAEFVPMNDREFTKQSIIYDLDRLNDRDMHTISTVTRCMVRDRPRK